jgi:hypothetical protein
MAEPTRKWQDIYKVKEIAFTVVTVIGTCDMLQVKKINRKFNKSNLMRLKQNVPSQV